jgi:hypothetical protein
MADHISVYLFHRDFSIFRKIRSSRQKGFPCPFHLKRVHPLHFVLGPIKSDIPAIPTIKIKALVGFQEPAWEAR